MKKSRRIKKHYFAIANYGSYLESDLLKIVDLFYIPDQKDGVLKFYRDNPRRLLNSCQENIIEESGKYYALGYSSDVTYDFHNLHVNLYDEINSEIWNPFVVNCAIKLVQESNNSKLSGGDKLIIKNIAINGFWEAIKTLANKPGNPTVGRVARASLNDIINVRLVEYGYDVSAGEIKWM